MPWILANIHENANEHSASGPGKPIHPIKISLKNKKVSTLYIFSFSFSFLPDPTNTHVSIYSFYVMSKQPAMFLQWKECTACPAAAQSAGWKRRVFFYQTAQQPTFHPYCTSRGHLLVNVLKRRSWVQWKWRKDNGVSIFISGTVQNQV